MTTPRLLRQAIADLERDRATLERQRAAVAAEIDTALASDTYAAGQVREQRQTLARVVERIAEIDARAAALTASLPSPARVAQAERELAELRTAAADTGHEFESAAATFCAALAAAEHAARKLAALRSAAATTIDTMTDVAAAAGLTVERLPVPTLLPAAAALCHLQALAAADAAHGAIDEVILLNLAAARVAARAA